MTNDQIKLAAESALVAIDDAELKLNAAVQYLRDIQGECRHETITPATSTIGGTVFGGNCEICGAWLLFDEDE